MANNKSRLLTYNILDIKDELDERLEKCYKDLTSITSSLRENELYEQLNVKVCQSVRDHEDTNLALLFSILTDSNIAPKSYSTLTLVTRDSMAVVVHFTELLILEKFPKLLETTRLQLMWLTRELIQTGVLGAERLCFGFLKQMPAGSTAPTDIWLAENLLHLFLDNRNWLDEQVPLVMSAVFTYLSILPSHLTLPDLSELKDLEIEFIISLLRNKFQDCIQIGRDLIRLLQNVLRIPQFIVFWNDVINNPHNLDSTFTGVGQILSKRTSRRFVAGRIVTDSEIKINFLLSKVKLGHHKRYQEWFSRKYLSIQENLTIIPELIRFVCCVIHPPNEVLGSEVLPRWAFIGWLLSIAQPHPVIFANSKLALFYDWLSYSPESDNIMNIEPAVLLMFHSLHSHPQLTMTLLDFLCRLAIQFSSQCNVSVGIQAAFQDIVQKGVLHSLDSLLSHHKLDNQLILSLKNVFPDLYPITDSKKIEKEEKVEEDLTISDVNDAMVSNEEIDVWSIVTKLPEPLREKMEEFRAHSDSNSLLQDILSLLHSKFTDCIQLVASPLTHCLSEQFEHTLTEENPLHILLKFNLIELITAMREIQWKLGYHLLYHLYLTNHLTDYLQYTPNDSSLEVILLRDLKECANDNSEVFFQLLPSVYTVFTDSLTGSVDMVNIIVSHVDPYHLNNIIIQLSLKKFIMFGKIKIQQIIVTSLQWDSFEQFCVWQLLIAEGLESHHIVTILRQISPTDHPEAISGVILSLKQEPNIPGAVGNLLSLSTTHSQIVLAVLSNWINSKPNKLAKYIDYCLNKVIKLSEPLPTLTPMLDHLGKTFDHIGYDIFKGVDNALSISLDKLFHKQQSLQLRYPRIMSAINESLTMKKRHISLDTEEVVRIKKRRVMTLEELSD